MSPRPSLTAGLAATTLLLSGCGEAPHGHEDEHGHGHHDHDNAAAEADHDGAHGHGDHGHGEQGHRAQGDGEAKPQAAAAAATAPAPFALGSAQGVLVATAEGLRLTVTDAAGTAVSPAGEAKVLLTGTGEDPQRVVLKADGDGWSGPARAAGAPGYIAVVSLELGGHTESGRTTWGTVPAVEAAAKAEAPTPDDHDDGHGHGHGH